MLIDEFYDFSPIQGVTIIKTHNGSPYFWVNQTFPSNLTLRLEDTNFRLSRNGIVSWS